jgi:hypothetical protein
VVGSIVQIYKTEDMWMIQLLQDVDLVLQQLQLRRGSVS